MSNQNFFTDLPPTTNLTSIVDQAVYQPTPENWWVVSSDIVSSTKAVEQGRYKQVNMSAGCIIAAVLNAAENHDLPYVFGGDGAAALIPDECVQKVREALIRTRYLIATRFELDMRIGMVPVQALRARGAELKVAKLELSPGNNIGLFRGGGMELAEQLIRGDTDTWDFAIPPSGPQPPPDLTGLSCRWEPLVSRLGAMFCVIVHPPKQSAEYDEVLRDIFKEISYILDNDLGNHSPVAAENMRFKWPPKGFMSEAKATQGSRPFLLRLIQILAGSFLQLLMERFDIKGGNYNPPEYRKELRSNSDYCRFDDALHLVLDCTNEQIEAISAMLDKYQTEKQIEYGTFKTQQALMTCLVNDLGKKQHVHFIDGDDGGFWAAATRIKQKRISASSSN